MLHSLHAIFTHDSLLHLYWPKYGVTQLRYVQQYIFDL